MTSRRWYTYDVRDSYLSEGINDAWWVHHRSVAKGNSADSPYLTPDDVVPHRCCAALPQICSGILLFDLLVANSDRHVGNLKVDDPDNPLEIDVFDHDRALFGAVAGQATVRL